MHQSIENLVSALKSKISILEIQISSLTSDLVYFRDKAHRAEDENVQLKAELEYYKNRPTTTTPIAIPLVEEPVPHVNQLCHNDINLHQGSHFCKYGSRCRGAQFLCGCVYINSQGDHTKCGHISYSADISHGCKGDCSTYFASEDSRDIAYSDGSTERYYDDWSSWGEDPFEEYYDSYWGA